MSTHKHQENHESKITDPVTPNQGGRMIPADPVAPTPVDAVRLRAYELYEQRGKTDGRALDDWLKAESQLIST